MPRQIEIGTDQCAEGDEITIWHLSQNGNKDWGQGGRFVARDGSSITIATPCQGEQTFSLAEHVIVKEEPFALDECVQYEAGVCQGRVEHFSPSGFGGPLRCEFHVGERLERYNASMERYAESDIAPSWFRPSWGGENDMGERWDDD